MPKSVILFFVCQNYYKEGIFIYEEKIIAAAAALTLLFTSAYAFNDTTGSIEQNPLDNELFSIVAEFESDVTLFAFDTVTLEYAPDSGQARVKQIKLGYDGKVEVNYLTDYTTYDKASEVEDEYNDFSGKYERMYSEYNDGLIRQSSLYVYKDINGNEYLFCDPSFGGFGYGYNLGLMKEEYTERSIDDTGMTVYSYNSDVCFYTVFSDDANYFFDNASISNFDDNGYAIMQYGGKQYVVKLKRGFIPTVFYNGEKIKFDQIPVIENGRTLVPLRAIFEKIGAEVKWDENTKTVTATKDGTEISLTLGSTEAIKNGEKVTLDTAAKSVNVRTLVPVRFIADCFGVTTDWDGTMQRVSLSSAQN